MSRKKFVLACLAFSALSSLVGSAVAAPPTTPNNITQGWDKNLPSSTRFTVLNDFGGAAVRDNNTGLVWERAPDTGFQSGPDAAIYCVKKNVGGTVGWRLPSVVELKSIQDPTLAPPFVPASVFSGIQLSGYWTATQYATAAGFLSNSWGVFFENGDVEGTPMIVAMHVWCVRGPMQESLY